MDCDYRKMHNWIFKIVIKFNVKQINRIKIINRHLDLSLIQIQIILKQTSAYFIS